MTMRVLTALLGVGLVVGGVLIVRSKLKADEAALAKDVADQVAKQKAANEKAAADAASKRTTGDAGAKSTTEPKLGVVGGSSPFASPTANLPSALGEAVADALSRPKPLLGPLAAVGVEDLPEGTSEYQANILQAKADYRYGGALIAGNATKGSFKQKLTEAEAKASMQPTADAMNQDAALLDSIGMRLAAAQLRARAQQLTLMAAF